MKKFLFLDCCMGLTEYSSILGLPWAGTSWQLAIQTHLEMFQSEARNAEKWESRAQFSYENETR